MTTYPQVSDSMAALSRADGTTVAHHIDHGRVIDFVVNAKTYLKGDGTAENQSDIDAFAAACAGKEGFFPPGIYVWPDGGSLTLNGNTSYRGAGQQITTITTKNAYAFKTPSTGGVPYVQMRNLSVLMRSGSTSGGGLKAYGTSGTPVHGNWVVSNVYVEGVTTSTDPLWYLDGIIGCRFYSCYAQTNGGIGFLIEGRALAGLGFVANANEFYSCTSRQCQGFAWEINGGSGTTINGGVTESNSGGGMHWNATVMPRVENVWFESNSIFDIKAEGASHGVINSCKFHSSVPPTHLSLADASASVITIYESRFQDPGSDPTYPNVYVGTGSTLVNYAFPGVGTTPTTTNFGQTTTGPGASYAPTYIGGVGGAIAVYTDLSTPGRSGNLLFNEVSSDPDAPAVNQGYLYMRDNGSGKTQLCARFPTGSVQVIATQP